MSDDSDGTDGVDIDSGLLEPDESLDGSGLEDILDEGYSPPEKPLAVNDWGTTEREAEGHEPLDARLARELPDFTADEDSDDLGDTSDTDGELYDDEVGTDRSGRLVEDEDARDDYFATDVGIDGAGASAEEAAVHVVPDDEY
jgi:hypothetical protein